eukprot:6040914-Alexandrium_andersonii.AAC.1
MSSQRPGCNKHSLNLKPKGESSGVCSSGWNASKGCNGRIFQEASTVSCMEWCKGGARVASMGLAGSCNGLAG